MTLSHFSSKGTGDSKSSTAREPRLGVAAYFSLLGCRQQSYKAQKIESTVPLHVLFFFCLSARSRPGQAEPTEPFTSFFLNQCQETIGSPLLISEYWGGGANRRFSFFLGGDHTI